MLPVAPLVGPITPNTPRSDKPHPNYLLHGEKRFSTWAIFNISKKFHLKSAYFSKFNGQPKAPRWLRIPLKPPKTLKIIPNPLPLKFGPRKDFESMVPMHRMEPSDLMHLAGPMTIVPAHCSGSIGCIK